MTQPTTAPNSDATPDAVDQAVELLRKFCAGEKVTKHGGVEKDCTAVIASALIAQADELRNISRLLGDLVARGADLVIPTGDEDAEQTPD